MRRLLPLLLLAAAACPKARPLPNYKGPIRSVKLMDKVEEAETASFKEQRPDIEVRTRDAVVHPSVMGVVTTDPVKLLPGMRATLAGDPDGRTGFYVDNFLLIEVMKGDRVVERSAVGFQEGAVRGNETIDNVGKMGFAFDPGEVDVTQLLTENEAVRLKVTALDYGNVGKVSDVYLILGGTGGKGEDDEELREK